MSRENTVHPLPPPQRPLRPLAGLRALVFGLCVLPLLEGRGSDIAFFYAVEADLAALAAHGKPHGGVKRIAGHSVRTLQIGAHRVHAVKMGAGIVQTAISSTVLLAKLPCDLAITVGPAGRLSDDLEIGRIAWVAQVIAYQSGTVGPADVPVLATTSFALPTPGANFAARSESRGITVASGGFFVASRKFRDELHRHSGAQTVDMNLAGLAVACKNFDVPLIAWKILSDDADENAAKDFADFTRGYAGQLGSLAAKFIEALPENQNAPEAYPELKRLLE